MSLMILNQIPRKNAMDKLPKGWISTNIGEVIELSYGRSLPEAVRTNGPYPVYGSNGIVGSHIDALIKGPCLIIGRKGSIGEVHLSKEDCWPIDTTYYINDFRFCDILFVKYLLKSLPLSSLNRATAIPGLNRNDVYLLNISLPPLLEQKRIAEKIDNLIAKIEAAQEGIKRIPKLIEMYKQTVLKSAFNGEFTLNWKKRNINNEQSINSNSIPSSWKIVTLGEIAKIQTGITLGKKRKASEVTHRRPYLRVANVQRGYLNLSEIKYVDVTMSEFEKLRLEENDILMNEGGDRDKLGRGWIWDEEIEGCIHQNHVFRVRLKDKFFPSKWVSYFANEFGQQYFFDAGQQTTNLASISKTKLSAMPIPIPPTEEAIEIIKRIEDAFLNISRIESQIENALKFVDFLRQSILIKALQGHLAFENDKDEPASDLIKRIQSDRITLKEKPVKIVKAKNNKSMIAKKSLLAVLTEAEDWLNAQDAFRLCGVSQSATTEEIEPIYSELRFLDQNDHILVDVVRDADGKKLYDRIRLKKRLDNASR